MNSTFVDYLRSQQWLKKAVPNQDHIFSMMTQFERSLLYAATKYHPNLELTIADLGTFVGASTAVFGEGLKHKSANSTIHCYDLYKADSHTINLFKEHGREIQFGDSYLSVFKEFTKDYEHYMNCYPGDICSKEWNAGRIDILFLDCLKSQEVHDHVLLNFLPHLDETNGILIHQDFVHDPLPWIVLGTYALKENLDLLPVINSSVVFKLKKSINRDDVAEAIRWLSMQDVDTLINIIENTIQEFRTHNQKATFEVTKLHVALIYGSRELFEQLIANFPWHQYPDDWVKKKSGYGYCKNGCPRFRLKIEISFFFTRRGYCP